MSGGAQGHGGRRGVDPPPELCVLLSALLEFPQRAGADVDVARMHGKRVENHAAAPGDHRARLVRLRFIRLFRCRLPLVDEDDPRIAIAAPVDTPKALDHALPRHEVADHVVCIEIDAYLAGRGSDKESGPYGRDVAAREKAQSLQPFGGIDPLLDPPRADEKLGLDRDLFALCQLLDRRLRLLRRVAAVTINKAADCLRPLA